MFVCVVCVCVVTGSAGSSPEIACILGFFGVKHAFVYGAENV